MTNKLNVENHVEQPASFIQFFLSLHREVFLKPRVEACCHEFEKNGSHFRGVCCAWIFIRTYLCHLLSYLQRINCTQERKDRNPKAER